MEKVETYLDKAVLPIVESVFREYPRLEATIIEAFESIIHELKEQTRDRVDEIMSWELNRPFTLNHYYTTTILRMQQAVMTKSIKKNDQVISKHLSVHFFFVFLIFSQFSVIFEAVFNKSLPKDLFLIKLYIFDI